MWAFSYDFGQVILNGRLMEGEISYGFHGWKLILKLSLEWYLSSKSLSIPPKCLGGSVSHFSPSCTQSTYTDFLSSWLTNFVHMLLAHSAICYPFLYISLYFFHAHCFFIIYRMFGRNFFCHPYLTSFVLFRYWFWNIFLPFGLLVHLKSISTFLL